jgi:hypothetical protein
MAATSPSNLFKGQVNYLRYETVLRFCCLKLILVSRLNVAVLLNYQFRITLIRLYPIPDTY